MSLLHSFYCWGAVGTIVISTLFFAVFGMDSWKWLAVLWALVPAINIYNFATCPIEHLVDEGEGMGIKELFRKPLFWFSICLMICSGASELAMAQWASAYAEAALGLSKTVSESSSLPHRAVRRNKSQYRGMSQMLAPGSEESSCRSRLPLHPL